MAEFNVKTISYSSEITAIIELNIGSLEREYKGNELDFAKTFVFVNRVVKGHFHYIFQMGMTE